MSTKAYMIHLQGQGDTEIMLVGEKVWNRVVNDREPNEEALALMDEDTINGRIFWSLKEAYGWMKDNDIEIVEEWEGHIY